MRNSTSTWLALCAALVANTTACTEALDADGAFVDGDDPVRLRSCPPLNPLCNLSNSPWVGSYAFSNLPRHLEEPALDPYGLATFEMGSATRLLGGQLRDVELVVTNLGRLRAGYGVNEYDIAGTTASFTIDPVGAGSNTTANLYFKSETIPSGATFFNMPRYEILTDVVPLDTDIFPEDADAAGWYHVCPQAEGTNRAIVLPFVSLVYDGELASLSNHDLTVVLACERQALAKGATKVEVLPASGMQVPHAGGTVDRQYGSANYNALVNAYRAFYAGDARTIEGTTIYLKDLAHDPPMFDQAVGVNLPPPPIFGYDDFFLESVYDGTGAGCRAYPSEFPNGVHRNASYSPPGILLPGWDDMDDCEDANHELADHGPVGVYLLRHIDGFESLE